MNVLKLMHVFLPTHTNSIMISHCLKCPQTHACVSTSTMEMILLSDVVLNVPKLMTFILPTHTNSTPGIMISHCIMSSTSCMCIYQHTQTVLWSHIVLMMYTWSTYCTYDAVSEISRYRFSLALGRSRDISGYIMFHCLYVYASCLYKLSKHTAGLYTGDAEVQ